MFLRPNAITRMWVAAFFEITKPRIMALAVFTALTGYVAASLSIEIAHLLESVLLLPLVRAVRAPSTWRSNIGWTPLCVGRALARRRQAGYSAARRGRLYRKPVCVQRRSCQGAVPLLELLALRPF